MSEHDDLAWRYHAWRELKSADGLDAGSNAESADEVSADACEALVIRVGPKLELVSIPRDRVASNTFVGAFIRQRAHFSEDCLDLPTRNAAFCRLLCAFWQESHHVAPAACTQYEVRFETFLESFGDEAPGADSLTLRGADEICTDCGKAFLPNAGRHDDDVCRFIAHETANRHPEAVPSINRALARHLDATRAIERSRVTLALRGGFILIEPQLASDPSVPCLWRASTSVPTVVNECRVRLVGHASVKRDGRAHEAIGGCFFSVGSDRQVSLVPRLLPAFTLWGRDHTNGDDAEWRLISGRTRSLGDMLEVRLFAADNVPRRPRCPEATEAALFNLDEELLWSELEFHLCDDLTFALARVVISRKSKLKNFMTARRPPSPLPSGVARAAGQGASALAEERPRHDGEASRLKQWPGKDAVQALAVWWIAALLRDDHRYTEPELYSIIESCCAMAPDYAVIRKEMVRRGFLETPKIVENEDHTTTTYYHTHVAGMRAVLQGHWRTKGVF